MNRIPARLRRTLDSAKPFLIPTALVLLAGAIVTGFTWQDEDDYYYKMNKGLETFGQVYREIAQSYVDTVDPEEFINAGIQGMLKTLDPYTVFLRKKESADIDLLTSGSYGGIGITVGLRDSLVTIVDVLDGYSAQREGVRIGDKIYSINGTTLLHGPVDALRDYTRGEPNTTLQMTVLRDGVPDPLTFQLTRENIRVRSVSYSGIVGDGVGYIRLERFSTNAGDETRTAILDMRKQGELKGLILDLRDNPGGLLESAVDVGAKFLPAGSTIVTTRGRDSSEERVYHSTEEPIAAGTPLVVLVNGGSASASEIVAGAIQDLDAGVILGTQSFGKGLVQSIRRLPHESTLKLTTARYYTPSGRSIQKIDYLQQRLGMVSVLADSLRSRYQTKLGRSVYERGGIAPDTLVEMPDTPTIVTQLRHSLAFFKFATRYSAGMKSLPQNFTVDNALLDAFEQFTNTNGVAAVNDDPMLMKLKELEEVSRQEKYGEEIRRKIESLRIELNGEQHRAFQRYREEIRRELASEISSRFHGQRERLQAMLANDHQLQTAVNLLHSGRGSYGRLLSVR
jgi:carboxyl-terminal processing protease